MMAPAQWGLVWLISCLPFGVALARVLWISALGVGVGQSRVIIACIKNA